MDRRRFLSSYGRALLLSANLVRGERRVVSANPLQVESDLTSLEGRYTALEDFYVRNHYETPPNSARPLLRLEGEVGKPVRFTPADLTYFKTFELGAVLECAGNPSTASGLVSNGMWAGWSLSEIIQLARPSRAAAFLHLFGRDGYARSVPMDRVRDGAMLVTHLGARPLQPDHGATWRAFFPGWYGMDSVKWLNRIVLSTAPLPDHENEYVEMRLGAPVGVVRRPLPRVQVKSVITSPADRSVVVRGPIEVRGLAWSGESGISKVQLTADEGTNWRDADLSPGSRYEWVLWRASLELSRSGATELVCRATGSNGHMQPERRDAERLDGYGQNWYHRVQVAVA